MAYNINPNNNSLVAQKSINSLPRLIAERVADTPLAKAALAELNQFFKQSAAKFADNDSGLGGQLDIKEGTNGLSRDQMILPTGAAANGHLADA